MIKPSILKKIISRKSFKWMIRAILFFTALFNIMIFIPMRGDYADFVDEDKDWVPFVAACRYTEPRRDNENAFKYFLTGLRSDYFGYLPGDYTEEFWEIATKLIQTSNLTHDPEQPFFYPKSKDDIRLGMEYIRIDSNNRFAFKKRLYNTSHDHFHLSHFGSEVYVWDFTNSVVEKIFEKRQAEGYFKNVDFTDYTINPNANGRFDYHEQGRPNLKTHYPSGYCDFMKHLIIKGGDFDPEILRETR